MTPRKTTTDASKGKLPLPASHPQKRPKRKRPYKEPRLTPEQVEAMVSEAIRRDALDNPTPWWWADAPAKPLHMPQPFTDPFTDQWIQAHTKPLHIVPDTRPFPWSFDTPILITRRWLSKKLTAWAESVAP